MRLNEEQILEWKKLCLPLIEWLNDNGNPHVKIIIEPTGAEMVSGECAFQTDEFIRD